MIGPSSSLTNADLRRLIAIAEDRGERDLVDTLRAHLAWRESQPGRVAPVYYLPTTNGNGPSRIR